MREEYIVYAKQLVKTCGRIIKDANPAQLFYKEGIADIVTNLDREVESYLKEELMKKYPAHSFLCEESDKELSDCTWIIDPIDGTTNFVNMHRDFAISLAYYHKKKPVFGIVYDVMRDEMFVGIHKEGAYLNDKQLSNIIGKPLSECILDTSMHTLRFMKEHYACDLLDIQKEIRGHRASGCASLNICHIAQGILDMYISSNVKCWDYAAACIILEEVNGAYSIAKDFFTTTGTFTIFANDRSLIAYVQENYLKMYHTKHAVS